MTPDIQDDFLQDRLARYDRWYREGKIPFSSRVIPVRESIKAQQWVVPTEQVLELLRELNGADQTVVMVTHDVQAAGCAGRIVQILDGRIQNE